MTDAVEATLRRVASHCAQKDEDLWPDAILQHLQLLAVPAVPLAQSSTPPAARDVAEPDILSWCVPGKLHADNSAYVALSDRIPFPKGNRKTREKGPSAMIGF